MPSSRTRGDASASAKPALEIRKYPNRRLYDVTRSRHLTADQLYELIRAGHDVVVTDSASGADITHQILTQMILERDSSKLEIFPKTLLHEIIRANQRMWTAFAEQWIAGVTRAVGEQASRYAERVARVGRAPLAATGLSQLFADAKEDLSESVRRLEEEVRRLRGERRPKRPARSRKARSPE